MHLAGVFAGDARKLSVNACFPFVAEFEREAGSIVLGMLKRAASKMTSSG